MSAFRATDARVNRAVGAFQKRADEFELFRKQVADFFLSSRHFVSGNLPLVHSVKSRLKDIEHLRDKIRRKWDEGPITDANIFERITDLAGVRVLHLYPRQFGLIHEKIVEHVEQKYWCLVEAPVAYSWDIEAKAYFEGLGITTRTRDTYYTSIHYIVKPQESVPITCEIQVRTLFEEIWGEVDHYFNYPSPTRSIACKEQLRVLAKLASTGSRLADSVFVVAQFEQDGQI